MDQPPLLLQNDGLGQPVPYVVLMLNNLLLLCGPKQTTRTCIGTRRFQSIHGIGKLIAPEKRQATALLKNEQERHISFGE